MTDHPRPAKTGSPFIIYRFTEMSSERRKPYPFDTIEPKWQQHWASHGSNRTLNPGDLGFDASRPKYFVLDMFPYPSGSGLHVGHPEGYTATDIVTRFKRMNGFNVLHPMGWDAFGLPAEQHAIKTGEHPRFNTQRNIANFRRQLQSLGFAYDWEREINTTDPGYVRWTQWIFLQLYHSYFDDATQRARPIAELEARGLSRDEVDAQRLAFVDEAPVNWSPDLGTVLANEEVEEWREKGHTVERRLLRQWKLRITKYAERLMADLDGLDWPESIKISQRNWIGRSEGARVTFFVEVPPRGSTSNEGKPGSKMGPRIEVFTTRPDTLFGATYMVLAPEHPLVDGIASAGQREAIAAYRAACAAKSDLERTELAKEKTGVDTGALAINPANSERIPIWIADYVLMGYGTGAIMAVPGHDARDWEFATKLGLPIQRVVSEEPPATSGDAPCHLPPLEAFEGNGFAVNSGFLDGLRTPEAKKAITSWLIERGWGHGTINYKLRDWLFSRQRYWGEPFPIIWDESSGHHSAIPATELPLLAPELEDYKPTGDPRGPLAKAKDWIRYSDHARRETNTMPQWAGSCWYYLRFCDPRNEERFVSEEAEKYWMGGGKPGGVDLYVGGTEHAVLHLLYARFWHKVLFDLGHLSTPEPFQRLVNQGLILGENGQKMSKSIGNVVNPDDVVREFGADSLRLFEMFMGPLTDTKPWSTAGVQGVHRFLARVWRLVLEANEAGEWTLVPTLAEVEPAPALRKAEHAAIKKVTGDIEGLAFNTAISAMMVLSNALTAASPRPVGVLRTLLVLLSPFAPHLAEELWAELAARFAGMTGLASEQVWPAYEEQFLIEDEIEIAIQIAGKLRDKIVIKKDLPSEEVQKLALAAPKIAEALAGKVPRKVIVVPNKIVNVVP